jgi:hypothetical protein
MSRKTMEEKILPSTLTNIFIHLVFSTKEKLLCLTPAVQGQLHACGMNSPQRSRLPGRFPRYSRG